MWRCWFHIYQSKKVLTTSSQRSTRKKGDSKSCQICSIRGHTYLKCEMLNTGNDGVIGITLQVNNRARRDRLAEDINSITNTIKYRKENDQRIVLQKLPKRGIAALQIHNKYFIERTQLVNTITLAEVCVECTLLVVGGNKNPEYTNVLFKPIQVSQFVQNSQKNLICTWL